LPFQVKLDGGALPARKAKGIVKATVDFGDLQDKATEA